jgi:hypothetical protein
MPNFRSQRQPSNLWQAPRIREGPPAGLWRSATRTMKAAGAPSEAFLTTLPNGGNGTGGSVPRGQMEKTARACGTP